MRTRLMGVVRARQRRARTQARRLAAMLRQYAADPVRNYRLRSEAAALARRVAVHVRQSEMAGRLVFTDRAIGARRFCRALTRLDP